MFNKKTIIFMPIVPYAQFYDYQLTINVCSFIVYPEVEARNSITLPSSCQAQVASLSKFMSCIFSCIIIVNVINCLKWQSSKPCGGMKFQYVDNSIVCHDYQEIKIQESTQVLGVGAIPRSILIILQDDLVDIVKAGGI